jgi:hypothetical protein
MDYQGRLSGAWVAAKRHWIGHVEKNRPAQDPSCHPAAQPHQREHALIADHIGSVRRSVSVGRATKEIIKNSQNFGRMLRCGL